MSLLFLIFGLTLVGIGVVFIIAFRAAIRRQEEVAQKLTTEGFAVLSGTDTKTDTDIDDHSRTVYYGIYEYDTADGRHISSAANMTYGDPADIPGTKGDRVRILYNSDNPTDFVIPSEQIAVADIWPKLRTIGIGLLAGGVCLTVLAAVFAFGLKQ